MIENLVLGAMWFGTRTDERRSFELLDRFVDAGGVWLDTADSYAYWVDPNGESGQSETVIGRWLASRPGVRDRVRISTKVGAGPAGDDAVDGLSATVVKHAVDGSRRRLGVDHLDMYWAHIPDPATPLAETVGAFDELVAAGTVGRTGLSNHPIWQVERARQLSHASGGAGVTALQQHHTYLTPRPRTWARVVRFGAVTDEVRHYLEHHPEVALWAYAPLLGGCYTNPDRPLPDNYVHDGTTRRLAALDKIAAETGANRNQVVLAWLVGGHPAASPIVGVSTAEQLDEAITGVSLTLTAAQRELLDSTA